MLRQYGLGHYDATSLAALGLTPYMQTDARTHTQTHTHTHTQTTQGATVHAAYHLRRATHGSALFGQTPAERHRGTREYSGRTGLRRQYKQAREALADPLLTVLKRLYAGVV